MQYAGVDKVQMHESVSHETSAKYTINTQDIAHKLDRTILGGLYGKAEKEL